MKEEHLIIIWEKAKVYKNEVIEYLKSKFSIIGMVEYIWDKEKADKNYSTFYGENLNEITYKKEHCGDGSFLIILVEDEKVKYDFRKTTTGERYININIFDAKIELRKMTGGGHKIHATDDTYEFKQNIISLFGEKYDDVKTYFLNNSRVERNITGVDGWNSWQEMLNVINKGTEYVILRNYEEIDSENKKLHGDLDILVKEVKIANTLCAGEKVFKSKNRVLFKVKIKNNFEYLDIRYLGDNYYDEKFEKAMIENRILKKENSIYILNEENYKYSLLYHALCHKRNIQNDYLEKFNKWFEFKNITELKTILDEFIIKKGYSYTIPKDYSVYLNKNFIKNIKLFRIVYIMINDLKSSIKEYI
jgi:hypothetical protein